jgi:hypothetical protein
MLPVGRGDRDGFVISVTTGRTLNAETTEGKVSD